VEGIKKSIELFQRAIVADPNYAQAYAGLANSYNVATGYGVIIQPKQAFALADEASRKALELDDTLSDAHTARAMVLANQWKWNDVEKEFRRAIELNPNDATAHYFYAFIFLMPEKRIDESLEEFRKALSLDPLSGIVNVNYALTLMVAHRYPEALAQMQKELEHDPSFVPAHYYLSQMYASTGQYADAVNEMQKLGPAPIPGSFSGDAQGYLKLAQDRRASSAPTLVAVIYALQGDRNKAFEYLEKAYAEQDAELMACIRFPAFDVLHSDPRYAEFMRKVGLPD
jgi:tetratricopeptide (TPR) repeat protein